MENKKQLVFNSEISFNESLLDDTKGKGRPFTSRFIEAGITHYQEFGDILITKETLDKFIHTMVGCPVVINHKKITEQNVNKERVGVISKVWFEPMDGWYWCEGIIWDKQAIDLVKNQGWNVSCTYDFVSDKQNKTHNGKKIDMEFIDGEFLHLALVENPRYERANIVINSKDESETVDNDDKWITVKPNGEDEKGRHLLLKDGESPKEAMKRQWGVDLDKKGKEAPEKKETKERTLADIKSEVAEAQKKLNQWRIGEDGDLTEYNKLKTKYDKLTKEMLEAKYKEAPKKDEFVEMVRDGKKEKIKTELAKLKEKFDNADADKKADIEKEFNTKYTQFNTTSTRMSHDEYEKLKTSFEDLEEYITDANTNKQKPQEIQQPKEEKQEEKPKTEPKNVVDGKREKYLDTIKKLNEAEKACRESKVIDANFIKNANLVTKYKTQLTKDRREYAESIMDNFEKSDDTTYQDKQNARRLRYEALAEKNKMLSSQAIQRSTDMMSVIPMGQPVHGQRDRNYRDRAWDKLGQGVRLSDKASYYEGKAGSVGTAGISSDDANAIAKLAQKYKTPITSAEKRRIIDRVISLDRARRVAEKEKSNPTDYSKYGFGVERNTQQNRLQLHFDDIPSAEQRSVLKHNGFRWSPSNKAWQRQLNGNSEDALKRVIEKFGKAENTADTGKENIVMTVLNDLTDFIKGIVSNTIADEEEKKAEKVENEEEKEEKEEKFEEEKEIANSKKAKNEEDKEEDKEETKEEDKEETKEEVKDKEVDNKCAKNSMDDVKNAVLGGSNSNTFVSNYTSRDDRLKAGEQY